MNLSALWNRSRTRVKPIRHRKDRRSLYARPSLEVLEARTLLNAYTVNVLTDNNPNGGGQGNGTTGDLRYCITQADSVAGPHTITFATGLNGPIDLAAALPALTQDMTIAPAAGATVTVERSNTAATDFRIFNIAAGKNVTFGAFTIQRGFLQAGEGDGGGILNNGTLTLNGAIVQNNQVDPLSGHGGGIYNVGTLRLNGGSIGGNIAQYGGGIYNLGSMSTVAGAPTLSMGGNQATQSGGAIFNTSNSSVNVSKLSIYNSIAQQGNGGGIYNDTQATLTIQNSTLRNNQAVAGSGGGIFNVGNATINQNTFTNNSAGLQGGAIKNSANASGKGNTVNGNQVTGIPGVLSTGGGLSTDSGAGISFSLVNTIVAQNTAPANPDVDGNFTDLGHNFIGDGTGGDFVNGVNGDQVGTSTNPLNPMLGPLQDNGGGIETELPLAGSPVIDAGDNTYAPATDERGYVRIINGIVDLGAVEYGSSPASPTRTSPASPNTVSAADRIFSTEGDLILTNSALQPNQPVDNVGSAATPSTSPWQAAFAEFDLSEMQLAAVLGLRKRDALFSLLSS